MTKKTELKRLKAAKNEAWSKVEAALAEEASAWEVARAARDAVEVAWEAWGAALAAATAADAAKEEESK